MSEAANSDVKIDWETIALSNETLLRDAQYEIARLHASELADRDTLKFMTGREESLNREIRVLSDTNEHLNITIGVLSRQLSSALSQISSLRYPVRSSIDYLDEGADADA